MKRVLTAGASPADSLLVHGVACRKSLAHKRMRSSIAQPRVMLLEGGIEVARSSLGSSGAVAKAGAAGGGGGMASLGSGLGSLGGSGAAVGAQSKLSSFDSMLDQEQQYLDAVVDRIASFNPDVLLVEGSVARCVPAQLPATCHPPGIGGSYGAGRWRASPAPRKPAPLLPCCSYAQELLLSRDISLVLNVKPELLERIARCTGARVRVPPLQQPQLPVGAAHSQRLSAKGWPALAARGLVAACVFRTWFACLSVRIGALSM